MKRPAPVGQEQGCQEELAGQGQGLEKLGSGHARVGTW
jgi:hypothetical protein